MFGQRFHPWASSWLLPNYLLSILGASVALATQNFMGAYKASHNYSKSLEDMISWVRTRPLAITASPWKT